MIVLLQNDRHDGPATLGSWLVTRGEDFEIIEVWAGREVPHSVAGIDALAVLGGPMGVSDDLAGLRATEHLLRDALAKGIPVLGHCLGGQLIASALGARVRRNPAPEIGWHTLEFLPDPQAGAWFGPRSTATVFQWHYDTFDLPPGATPLARSAACANQAFAIGSALAMQFHIEVDLPKLDFWAQHGAAEVALLAGLDTVQTPEAQGAGSQAHLGASQALAATIYEHWLALAADARRLRRASGQTG